MPGLSTYVATSATRISASSPATNSSSSNDSSSLRCTSSNTSSSGLRAAASFSAAATPTKLRNRSVSPAAGSSSGSSSPRDCRACVHGQYGGAPPRFEQRPQSTPAPASFARLATSSTCRVLAQDCLLELLERLAGLDPELIDERAAGLPVRGKSFGLAPAAVQGKHQLRAKALAQRMSRGECLELADDLRVAAEDQVGLDAILDCGEAQLLEPSEVRPGERIGRELGQRSAPPERECLAERPTRARGIALREQVASRRCTFLEPGQIEALGVHGEQVAARPRPEDVCSEHPAEARDLHLQGFGRVRGRCLGPQKLDQAARRDDFVRVQEQKRQQRTLLAAAELDLACGALDLEGAQDPELHDRLATSGDASCPGCRPATGLQPACSRGSVSWVVDREGRSGRKKGTP